MRAAAALPGAAALRFGATARPNPGMAATGDEAGVRDEMIGRGLKGSMGPFRVRVLHREDGSSVVESAMGNDEGRWRIEQGQLCVRWNTMRGGRENCGTLEPIGGGQYRTSGRGVIVQVEN